MTEEKKKRTPRVPKHYDDMTPEEKVIHAKQQEIKAIRAAKKAKLHDEAQARKRAKEAARAELDNEKEIVNEVKGVILTYNALGKGKRRAYNVLAKIAEKIHG